MAEADESDRSFLLYRPHVAIVTNIDADHLNTYGDLAGLEDAFVEFCRPGRAGRLRGDLRRRPGRPAARRAGPRAEGRPCYTYGESDDADLRLSEVVSSATGVRYLADARRRGAGRDHPAAPRAGTSASTRPPPCSPRCGWASPIGRSPRRWPRSRGCGAGSSSRASPAGVRVYDEYAYHPTSMTAAMQTLREVAGDGRLIVVFQPYRVYRTRDCEAEIAAALAIADEAVFMEVFGPGEVREPGQGGVALTAAVDAARRPQGVRAVVGGRARRGGPPGPRRATWW